MRSEKNGVLGHKPSSKNVKVYCWGLNDKGQLAGVKGSKVCSCSSVIVGFSIIVVADTVEE